MAICVVLDGPENPDNIGAVARAMKNMGLHDLRLVRPPEDWQAKAGKMAVGAAPLLSRARVYTGLKEAVKDTRLVIGTTRRTGYRRRAFLEFDQAIEKLTAVPLRSRAAVVFGKESKGLSNESLHVCDWFTTIPCNPDFGSINLAQAVMIVCFSLHRMKPGLQKSPKLSFVSKEEFESVMGRFVEAVKYLEYKPEIVARIDATFRAMLKRGGLLKSEGEMIKGLSRRILERTQPRFQRRSAGSRPPG